MAVIQQDNRLDHFFKSGNQQTTDSVNKREENEVIDGKKALLF